MKIKNRTIWLLLSCSFTLLMGLAMAEVVEPPAPVVKIGVVGAQAVNTAPTFVVSNGTVTTDIGGKDDSAHSITLQPDGKLVVAGYGGGASDYDFVLARYLPDGSLDTGFGTGGKVITDFGFSESAHSITLQPDGKLVVAGYSYNGVNFDIALARYLPDGSLDTNFGISGRVITNLGGHNDAGYSNNDYGHSISLQSDGKLVVAGYVGSDFALARYLSDGGLDTSFGTGGKVTTDFFGGYDAGNSITLQPDGKLVVAGYAHNGVNNDFALALNYAER